MEEPFELMELIDKNKINDGIAIGSASGNNFIIELRKKYLYH